MKVVRLVSALAIAVACLGLEATLTSQPVAFGDGGSGTIHGSMSNQNACVTNVDLASGEPVLELGEAAVDVSIETDASPEPHEGEEIVLTNTASTITFPAELFQWGVDTGIIADGMQLSAVVKIIVEASNTESEMHAYVAATQFVVDVADGEAQPLTVMLDLPDTSWSPVDPETPVDFQQVSMSTVMEIDVFGGLVMTAFCEPSGNPTIVVLSPFAPPVFPDAPPSVWTLPGDGRASATWLTPADGGSPITEYRVTVVNAAGGAPAGVTGSTTRTVSGSTTVMTFPGLRNGTQYRLKVAAKNGDGVGPYSALSDIVTPRPSVSAGDASVTEGRTGNRGLRFTVSISALSTKTVSVTYATVSGSAKAGSDYTHIAGTATIAAGSHSAEVVVPVRGDMANEATESFTLKLSTPTNAALGRAEATGKILNDDPSTASTSRRISIGDASVLEGRSGTRSLRLTVSLSHVSTKTTTVKYTTADGSAKSTSDYTKTSGTLTIAAGRVTAVVLVPVRGDTTTESSETFKVTLSKSSGPSLARAIATATILNDD